MHKERERERRKLGYDVRETRGEKGGESRGGGRERETKTLKDEAGERRRFRGLALYSSPKSDESWRDRGKEREEERPLHLDG